jgi:prolyl-tRNA synthetase
MLPLPQPAESSKGLPEIQVGQAEDQQTNALRTERPEGIFFKPRSSTMRMSHLFSRTLREVPSEAELVSHQLLLRAGFIRQLAAGVFSYLPLARRSLHKIEIILRQEIEAIGGQEISMPVVHPAELWKESGRWYKIDAEMGRFRDRSEREMVLGMTHEEVVTDLARREIRSYRQLPQLIYQIQTKWRDDPRPRAGLIRTREFSMKDSYSLDATWEGLERQYRAHYQAYFNIFRRCGLDVIAVKADVGMMGGQLAHEFMYLTPAGEDTLILCPGCGYSANRQIARFDKSPSPQEPAAALEPVATPGCKTIEDLANFLSISKAKTAKAVFLVATLPIAAHQTALPADQADDRRFAERFVFVIVRGDMEVNETKLANALNARMLRPASEPEIQATGAVPGYASPIGLSDVLVVVDDLIPHSPNLVAGANREGYHLRNVNYGRDFQAQIVADIANAQAGDPCVICGQPLKAVRGVEVGNIFQLGTHFSQAMGCQYVDPDGQLQPIIMGSYGIGAGRLLACIAEEHHDEYGLRWPISIAPFQVHLVALAGKSSGFPTSQTAEDLYLALQQAGIDVLFDDREESPGVKFNDADLIGIPLRLTVSERALKQGGVEFKRRAEGEKVVLACLSDDGQVNQSQIIDHIKLEIAALQAAIRSNIVAVPYEG